MNTRNKPTKNKPTLIKAEHYVPSKQRITTKVKQRALGQLKIEIENKENQPGVKQLGRPIFRVINNYIGTFQTRTISRNINLQQRLLAKPVQFVKSRTQEPDSAMLISPPRKSFYTQKQSEQKVSRNQARLRKSSITSDSEGLPKEPTVL